MTPLPTNDTDFVNHPVVSCLKSGKWVAEIQHPIRKVCVCVGIYNTPQEAADACTRKKLEYESLSEQEKAASFPTDVTNIDKHVGIRRVKSGKWEARIKHNNVRLQLGSYDTANEAADAYNLSKLELDSQKLVCSGKAGAVYSTESGTSKAADKRPVKAVVEQSVQLHRPLHAYRARAGRWRTGIRHPIIKGKTITLGGFHTAEEAANAYDSIRHDLDFMFPGHKKIKQSNNSCKAEAFAEGNSDSTCVSGDPQAEEAFNNKIREVNLIVRAHRKRKQYKGSCEAAAVVEGTSHSTCISGDPSVSTRVHMGTCTEEAEDAYKVDVVVESKSNPAFVSDEPSVSTRVHLGTFTEQADKAYNKCKQSKDICDLGEQSQKNQRLSHVYPTEGGRWRTKIGHPITKARVHLGTFGTAEEAKEAYDSKRREFDSMFPSHKTKDSRDMKAGPEQSQKIQRPYCADEAEEAEGISYSTFVYDDPSTSSDGSLVIKTGREEETRGTMLNENVQSVPMFVTEERGEFDSDVIDSYGQLVGEYSRLDDELWLCRSKDDAILEHDDGHECC